MANTIAIMSIPDLADTFIRVPLLPNVATFAPGSTFGPRMMESFELVWVLQGSATWTILDDTGDTAESIALTPGLMALSTPKTAEHYRWAPEVRSVHAYVHFEADAIEDTSRWPRVRSLAQYPLLGVLAEALFHASGAVSSATDDRLSQLVRLMLQDFLHEPVPTVEVPGSGVPDRVVQHVRSVWSADGLRLVTIAEIAGALSVSHGHVSRAFRDQFGLGPAAALEMVRLCCAAVSLQRTSLSLAEIAAECGFSDEYHMSRRFSRLYGTAPGSYRRRHRDSDPLTPLLERRLLPLWGALIPRTHTDRTHARERPSSGSSS